MVAISPSVAAIGEKLTLIHYHLMDYNPQLSRDLANIINHDLQAIGRSQDDLLALAKRARQKLVAFATIYSGDSELRGLLEDWDTVIAKVEAA